MSSPSSTAAAATTSRLSSGGEKKAAPNTNTNKADKVASVRKSTGGIAPREGVVTAAAPKPRFKLGKDTTAKASASKSPGSPASAGDKEAAQKPLTDEEKRAMAHKTDELGVNITKFTNDFKRQYDTNVAVVTTVSAADFEKNWITSETVCFVCEDKLEDKCAQVKVIKPRLLNGNSGNTETVQYAHPTCFCCSHFSEATHSTDEVCGEAAERWIPAGVAPHNKDGKAHLGLVHLSDGKPVCLKHLSDKHLDVPTFDPATQAQVMRAFISLWGFAKVKTTMTVDHCVAEYERIPLVVGMMNGADEKSMRTKLETESNWDVHMSWCDKERGLFGLICDSKAKEGMPDDINKLLANGIRADPILSSEAFAVRATATSSLLEAFPIGCNAKGNIMTDLGPYVMIPKESYKMSAHGQLQCFSGEKRLRASDKRTNSLQAVHGVVFFSDTTAETGGISILVCPEQWMPSKNAVEKSVFADMMDEITPRAPNYGLFSKDHPFSGLPVPIPCKAGEAVVFRNARPFCLRAGTGNIAGMIIGATDMIPKKQTWVHRARAIENQVLPKKDSNRSGIKYPAKTNSPFTEDSPCDWAGFFTPVKAVHLFAREVFGTGYPDPLDWPAEYRPKARVFEVTSPKSVAIGFVASSSTIAEDEGEMQAIVEEENVDETAGAVAAAGKKKAAPAQAAKKKAAAPAQAAKKKAAVAAATPPKKTKKLTEADAEKLVYEGVTGEKAPWVDAKGEEAAAAEEAAGSDAEPMDIEEEVDAPAAEAEAVAKKATPSKSAKRKEKAAAKMATLITPSSEKEAREDPEDIVTMRGPEELQMRDEFFAQEDDDDILAGFSAFVKKKGGDETLKYEVVGVNTFADAPDVKGVRTKFKRGTTLTACQLSASVEDLDSLRGHVDTLVKRERKSLVVAGKDTIPGNVKLVYGAPIHWNKMHIEPEPETPGYVTNMMEWLNTERQPFGTKDEEMPRINQCLMMTLSRKNDFIKEMHRVEDIHDGSMLHLVLLGNEERTVRFRSTRPPDGKEKGLGQICLDLNLVSGMVLSLSAEYCNDDKGMTYEVLRLPKAGKSDTSEADCEPMCLLAFYSCAPVSQRPGGKAKNGSKYQRTKAKPKAVKKAPTVASVVGVKMSKETPLLGGKTHEETLAELRAFLVEHKAVITNPKNAKTFAAMAVAAQKAAKESEKTKSTGAKLGDFQRVFAALHKGVTGEVWDAGPKPKDDEEDGDDDDDDEDIDLGFEPMDLEGEDAEQAPAAKPKKKELPKPAAPAKQPQKKKVKAATTSTVNPNDDDMQTSKQPASPVEPGSLFAVPDQTRKHVVTASGEVARRSARPKSGPVKTKADVIAEEQNELAKKSWLASEKVRAKKNQPKQSFAAYKANLIKGEGKGAAKGTFIGEKRARPGGDDSDGGDSDGDSDGDDDEVQFDSSDESGSDAGGDSNDEADKVDEKHVDLGAMLATCIETLDALFTSHQKKLDGPKKDKKLYALYEKAEELKDAFEEHDNLSEEQVQLFKESVRALGLALGVEVLASDSERDDEQDQNDDDDKERKPAKEKRRADIDLTGATVIQQGWNAEMDPEGVESARFITSALTVLQTMLAKDEGESAETIALLDSTIQLLSAPPSVGLRVKAMTEFQKLAGRYIHMLEKQEKKERGALVQQQIAFPSKKAVAVAAAAAAEPVPVPVPGKGKEEMEEEEQQQEDDGEAKPMEVEEDPEEEVAPVFEEDECEEMVPVAKVNDAESDTGGSDEEDLLAAEADAEQEAEEAKEELAQQQQAEAEEEEEEEEQLEGSAAEATKDKVKAANPEEEEELVDENPSPSASPSKNKRARDEPEAEAVDDEDAEQLEVEVEEAVMEAPSPSKRAAVAAQPQSPAKKAAASQQQQPQQYIAAVVSNKRIFGVYESEELARAAVNRQFVPKAGETVDKYCTFRPLPAHWKSFLTVKLSKEPIIENLKSVEAAALWPELAQKN